MGGGRGGGSSSSLLMTSSANSGSSSSSSQSLLCVGDKSMASIKMTCYDGWMDKYKAALQHNIIETCKIYRNILTSSSVEIKAQAGRGRSLRLTLDCSSFPASFPRDSRAPNLLIQHRERGGAISSHTLSLSSPTEEPPANLCWLLLVLAKHVRGKGSPDGREAGERERGNGKLSPGGVGQVSLHPLVRTQHPLQNKDVRP